MKENGHTLVEMLFVLLILGLVFCLGLPSLKAYSSEAHILGAASIFKQEFLKARSIATTSGRQTAIRFESVGDIPMISVYQDGGCNGVLSTDITRGIDRRISGPHRLESGAPTVRIAIHPNIPNPPPESGTLDPSDPIRFGRSNMVSFTPTGGATPGTFYLAGENGVQAAIRVTGNTNRIRVLVYRGRKWREQ